MNADSLWGGLPRRFYPIAISGFLYLTQLHFILVGVLIFRACWGTRVVTKWAFLSSIVKPELKTLAIGYMESFWDVGGTLGSPMAGFLVSILSYQQIFLFLAIFNLPTLPAILQLKEARKS